MTKEDVKSQFYDFVIQPYDLYNENRIITKSGRRNDLRLAFDAAISLYHFREYLDDKFKIKYQEIVNECPEYVIVKDIANYSKHDQIDKYKPLIRKKDDIHEEVFTIELSDDKGDYFNAWKEVVIIIEGKNERIAIEVFTIIINFWSSYLFKCGVLENKIVFETKQRKFYRENENGAATMDLSIIKGNEFSQRFRLLKGEKLKKE